jgi:predicted PurR-regulated permease PerM
MGKIIMLTILGYIIGGASIGIFAFLITIIAINVTKIILEESENENDKLE